MNAKHAPTPWAYTGGGDIETTEAARREGHRLFVARVLGDSRAEIDANAAFIVDACNNYEAVCAERDRLRAALETYFALLDSDPKIRGAMPEIVDRVFGSKARAALANK